MVQRVYLASISWQKDEIPIQGQVLDADRWKNERGLNVDAVQIVTKGWW